jgi:hypothetical protein
MKIVSRDLQPKEIELISFEEFLAEFEKTASQEYFDAKEKLAPYFEFEVQRLQRATEEREAKREKLEAQRASRIALRDRILSRFCTGRPKSKDRDNLKNMGG